jgi:hypothetical protein
LEAVARIQAEVVAALRRKPANEPKLAGALRALAPQSTELRTLAVSTVETLVKRASFQRTLYKAAVRVLGEIGDRRVTPHLKKALLTDGAGGLASLSAASFATDPGLGDSLARVATSRHSHLAFCAEVARVARGESDGGHVASVAPKIKEAHRIEICVEVLVPLLWRPSLPVAIAPALAVLRDAERHLGRWLVLGELAGRAGDPRPLEEARLRATEGPSSSRAAWALVAWALEPPGQAQPAVRPTVELVARLSDRPSADRDPTFLYRLADARVPSARSMLENLAKGPGLHEEAGIRAALYLIRDHGREDLRDALVSVARNPRREAVRGIAVAALFDAGERAVAQEIAAELVTSKQLCTMTWAMLVHAAKVGRTNGPGLVDEATYRRVQLGWIE